MITITNADISWSWRVEIIVLLLAAAALYIRGSQKAKNQGQAVSPLRLFSFWSGWGLLSLTLLSPIHTLATQLFVMRVAEHILLIAPIPALLLASNPLPVFKQALPLYWQYKTETHFAAFRARLHKVTGGGVALAAYVSAVFIWYEPVLHQISLVSPWVRTLELGSMLAAALFYWWHITGAAPQLHPHPPFMIYLFYTGVGALPLKIMGLAFLFAATPMYSYPINEIEVWDMSGQEAQQILGGILIWLVGGLSFTAAAGVIVRQWLEVEGNKPALPISSWAREDKMIAPGLENRGR